MVNSNAPKSLGVLPSPNDTGPAEPTGPPICARRSATPTDLNFGLSSKRDSRLFIVEAEGAHAPRVTDESSVFFVFGGSGSSGGELISFGFYLVS